MKISFPIIVVFFIISIVSAAGAQAGYLTILSPRDNSFVESNLISVIVRMEGNKIDDIRVTVGGKNQNTARKPMDKFYVCFDGIRLTPGINPVRVTGLKDAKKVEEINYNIFFRSDLSSEANSAPAGYARYYFHPRDNEKECVSCHQLDFSKAPENPSSPEQSPCFTCHKKMILNYRLVHGPAAVWSCPICHDVRSTSRRLGVRQPDEKTCRACHENAWQTKKYQHGPTAAGNCTACHNPHAADEPSFLRIKTADLCAACHEDIASRPHLVSGFSGYAGHPVRKSPDPFNPGRDFTCASCHNPHASDYSVLLTSDNSSMSQFCQSCHKM
jgi:predicted CXXCH cytochrome family protein